MRKKRTKIIIPLVIILVLVLGLLAYFYFATIITFKLDGDSTIELELVHDYTELGVVAKSCNKFKCQDITSEVIVTNNIDNTKVGDYKVTYQLNDKVLERIVKVLEYEPPLITLKGSQDITMCPGTTYVEEGYSAIDNYDGDITENVSVSYTDIGVLYTVYDSSNNSDIRTRLFHYVDNEDPVIKLNGDNIVYISLGDEFTDAGATASDNCDGDITKNITINSNVDTSKKGKYEVTYSIKDTYGNTASVTRKVNVYSLDTKVLSEYQAGLESYIKDKGYRTSIIYYNLSNGYTYKYNENQVYYGASLIKTLDALYVYEKMEVTDGLRDLVKPTIEVSNNTTHRKLVDIIGINNLRAYGKSIGAKYCLTNGNSDYYASTTANDQLIYFKYLWNFVNTSPLGEELKGYFLSDYYKFLTFDEDIKIMHKYGYYGSYFHDVGIVLDGDDPYIVVILTLEGQHDFRSIIKDLSTKVYGLHELTK